MIISPKRICPEKFSKEKGRGGGAIVELVLIRLSNLSLFLPLLSDNMKFGHLTITNGIERAIRGTCNIVALQQDHNLNPSITGCLM
jgi:hypothetical protein